MAKDKEPQSAAKIVAEINKQSGGTNIVKEYKDIFSNTSGSDLKTDLITDDKIEALSLLQKLVEQKKASIKKEDKRKKWEFPTSPHEDFGKSLDDTYAAFLAWARVKQDESKINVSKAFRRLETYADWMDETGKDLIEPKLTASSIKDVLDLWCMNSSYDKEGHVLWWCDMSRVRPKEIHKKFTPEDSLRAFVWYCHAIMYDENAQKNGMKFVYNVDKMGLMASFTLMPAKLSTKLDRLTIGVLPVKMKGMYMLDAPTWMTVFMKVIGVFMSKKMRDRIVFVKDWGRVDEIFGLQVTPKAFGKLEGKLEQDLIEERYFS